MRNDAPLIGYHPHSRGAEAEVVEAFVAYVPSHRPPRLRLAQFGSGVSLRPEVERPYQIEIWAEKTTGQRCPAPAGQHVRSEHRYRVGRNLGESLAGNWWLVPPGTASRCGFYTLAISTPLGKTYRAQWRARSSTRSIAVSSISTFKSARSC